MTFLLQMDHDSTSLCNTASWGDGSDGRKERREEPKRILERREGPGGVMVLLCGIVSHSASLLGPDYLSHG